MKYLMILILLMVSSTVSALPECYGSSWWETRGEGIILEYINDERTIGYLYTYGQDGHQRWYVLSFGENDSGPIYGTDKQSNEYTVGWASLDVIEQVEEGDKEMLLFVFDIKQDPMKPPWCLHGVCTGEWLVTRPKELGSCE